MEKCGHSCALNAVKDDAANRLERRCARLREIHDSRSMATAAAVFAVAARAVSNIEPLASLAFGGGLSRGKRRGEGRERENANHPGSDSVPENPDDATLRALQAAPEPARALYRLLQKFEENGVDLIRMRGGHAVRSARDVI